MTTVDDTELPVSELFVPANRVVDELVVESGGVEMASKTDSLNPKSETATCRLSTHQYDSSSPH